MVFLIFYKISIVLNSFLSSSFNGVYYIIIIFPMETCLILIIHALIILYRIFIKKIFDAANYPLIHLLYYYLFSPMRSSPILIFHSLTKFYEIIYILFN